MPDARRPGPWIDTIAWDLADGVLKEAYDWQAERLGEPTEFTMLGSLYPDIVMERLRLYRAVEGCPSALDARERIAADLAHHQRAGEARTQLQRLLDCADRHDVARSGR